MKLKSLIHKHGWILTLIASLGVGSAVCEVINTGFIVGKAVSDKKTNYSTVNGFNGHLKVANYQGKTDITPKEINLDYNSPINPFSQLHQNNYFGLYHSFYSANTTQNNNEKENHYKSFEWQDLSSSPSSDQQMWLSELVDYLKTHNGQKTFPISVATDNEYPNLSEKQKSYVDYLVSDNVVATTDWSMTQMGMSYDYSQLQLIPAQPNDSIGVPFGSFVNIGDDHHIISPIFDGWSGSDFYWNYSGENDKNYYHSPHAFSLDNIKFKINDPINFAPYDKEKGNYNAYVNTIDVSTLNNPIIHSDYKPISTLSNLFEIKNDKKSYNQQLITLYNSIQGSGGVYPISFYFNYNGYKWQKNSSGEWDYTWDEIPWENKDGISLFDPENSNSKYLEQEQELGGSNYYSALYSNKVSNYNNVNNFPQYNNTIPVSTKDKAFYWDHFTNFHHEVGTDEGIENWKDSRIKKTINLPTPLMFDLKQNLKKHYLNFSSENNNSGYYLHLELKNKQLTTSLKSGKDTINSYSQIVDDNFINYLTMNLNPLYGIYSSYYFKDEKNPNNVGYISNKKGLTNQVKSADFENINDLSIDLPINNNDIFSNLPFTQKITNDNNGSNTARIINNGLAINNYAPVNKINLIYYLKDGDKNHQAVSAMSNITNLNTHLFGANNQIFTNLDYLLSVYPTSTDNLANFSLENTTKVGLNPYYIYASANAYNAHHWLMSSILHNDNIWKGKLAKYNNNFFKYWVSDLIYRGFIQSQSDWDDFVNSVINSKLDINNFAIWFSNQTYPTWYQNNISNFNNIINKTGLPSYVAFNGINDDNYSFIPTPLLNNDYQAIPELSVIYKDKPLNTWIQKHQHQAQWVNFLINYHLSPQTWSFLMAIPDDYTFNIPYGYTNNYTHDLNSNYVSSLTDNDIKTISVKWKDLLNGNTFDFDNTLSDKVNNANQTLWIGLDGNNKLRGIYGENKQENNNSVASIFGETVSLGFGDYANIQLATITLNKNGSSKNPIHQYLNQKGLYQYIANLNNYSFFSQYSTNNAIIFDNHDINWLLFNQSFSITGYHLNLKKYFNPTYTYYLSGNTYAITRINQKYDLSNEFVIDSNTNQYGIEANYVEFRPDLSALDTTIDQDKYVYPTSDSKTSGLIDNHWKMKGIAPSEWFNQNYQISINGYTTYTWALHPSGLWAYHMNYNQDINQDIYGHGKGEYLLYPLYNLPLTMDFNPIITPIYSSDSVPINILNTWKQKWNASINKRFSNLYPVYVTNNATNELAFSVAYPALAYTDIVGHTVIPMQYVYYCDAFYSGNFSAKNSEVNINDLPKLSSLYASFNPSYFDQYTDYHLDEGKEYDNDDYSISLTHNLFNTNEIINWINNNIKVDKYWLDTNLNSIEFNTLLKKGWINLTPTKFDDTKHTIELELNVYPNLDFKPSNKELYPQNNPSDNMAIQLINQAFKNEKVYDLIKNPAYPKIQHKVLNKEFMAKHHFKTYKLTIKGFNDGSGGSGGNTDRGIKNPLVVGLIVATVITPIMIGLFSWLITHERKKGKKLQ